MDFFEYPKDKHKPFANSSRVTLIQSEMFGLLDCGICAQYHFYSRWWVLSSLGTHILTGWIR